MKKKRTGGQSVRHYGEADIIVAAKTAPSRKSRFKSTTLTDK
jgi:hypothetical protein